MNSLARAVVDAISWFELGGDEDINPDFAVRAMESVCAILADATAAEKAAVVFELQKQLAEDRSGDYTTFLRSLLNHFGEGD